MREIELHELGIIYQNKVMECRRFLEQKAFVCSLAPFQNLDSWLFNGHPRTFSVPRTESVRKKTVGIHIYTDTYYFVYLYILKNNIYIYIFMHII